MFSLWDVLVWRWAAAFGDFNENCTTMTFSDYPEGVVDYFPGYQTADNLPYWWLVDYTCDAIYIIDIVLVKSRVQFIGNGLLEVCYLFL